MEIYYRKNMRKLYFLLIILIIYGCNKANYVYTGPVYVGLEYVEHETLIKLYDPITTGGEVYFLSKKDNQCELWEFSYASDPKYNDAHCKLVSKEIYDIGDERIPYDTWETATGLEQNFKRHLNSQKSVRRKYRNRYKDEERSLNCLADNFLQLSNDEKLEILKKRSRGEEWGPIQLSYKKITWKSKKFPEDICLEDTCQIIDWGNQQLPWATSYTNQISVDGKQVFILVVNGYSGLIRSGIYVFKEEDNKWKLVAEGLKMAMGTIKTEIDQKDRKIIFKESTRRIDTQDEITIGELVYEDLESRP